MGEGGRGHIWNRAVKMSRLHKDQLCTTAATFSQPLTVPPPPLMEEAEAGAVEGWVTTGSRRLSKETKRVGLILDWSRVA